MADSATWICLLADELKLLQDYIEDGRALTEDECAILRSRVGIYTAPGARDQNYRDAAEGLHFVREGECEIDENAVVSTGGDPGAYVMAWVWVPDEETVDAEAD